MSASVLPTANIWISPALYIRPEDAAEAPFENCGQDRYCYLAPQDLKGVCGTWLGRSNSCCWIGTRVNSEEGFTTCDSLQPGIESSSIDQLGSSDAFNATGTTCPSGSYSFFDYEDEPDGPKVACCPNGQLAQVFYITSSNNDMFYYLDTIRCGNFEISGGIQNPQTGSTTTAAPSSTETSNGSATSTATTSGGRGGGSSRSEPTSEPPASNTNANTGTAISTGNQPTTTSGSDPKSSSKLSYLLVGSILLGFLFGGNL